MEFKREFDYIKSFLMIYLKSVLEYKNNLIFFYLANFAFIFTITTFILGLTTIFEGLFYWSFKEFFFYIVFMEIIVFMFHPLADEYLKDMLIKGELNTYLCRPVSTFLQYMMHSSNFSAFCVLIFYVPLLVFFLIFIHTDFEIFNLFLVVIFGITGGLFYLCIIIFLNIFSFFIKEIRLLVRPFRRAEQIFYMYPATFFQDRFISKFVLFLPVAYFGAFSTEFFFGYITLERLIELFCYQLILILILIILSSINWHYGLKRYEAFG